MYPVSPAFLAALGASHLVTTKVEVLVNDQPAAELTGRILAGSQVTAAKGQLIRRSCVLRMVDDTGEFTPTDATSLLAPYGNELRIWRGIQFADGSAEYAPLGVFEITDAKVQDVGAGFSIDLTGLDRADEVSRNTLTDVFNSAGGLNHVGNAKTLVNNARPGLSFSLFSPAYATPLVVYMPGDDPWAKASALLQSVGGENFFDPLGVCVMQPEPDLSTQGVVQRFIEGPTCTMTELERLWTNRSIPNNVIREGQGTGVAIPVRATSRDLNPSSPTYFYGNYGVVTDFKADSKLVTAQQCQDAADAVIRQAKGKLEQITLKGIPNPALDISDVVWAARAKLGVGGAYGIAHLTMPLDYASPMALTLRRVIA